MCNKDILLMKNCETGLHYHHFKKRFCKQVLEVEVISISISLDYIYMLFSSPEP